MKSKTKSKSKADQTGEYTVVDDSDPEEGEVRDLALNDVLGFNSLGPSVVSGQRVPADFVPCPVTDLY